MMSVHGVGVDLVDLRRFDRLCDGSHERLLDRWFTTAESAACRAASRPGRAFAETFAVKEAVWKALGVTDWDGRVPWAWIEVDAAPSPPQVRISGPVALHCPPGVHVTVGAVTSTGEVAAAVATATC